MTFNIHQAVTSEYDMLTRQYTQPEDCVVCQCELQYRPIGNLLSAHNARSIPNGSQRLTKRKVHTIACATVLNFSV